MGTTFRPYSPDQELLLPPSLNEWLPEGHLAYFVSDVVEEMGWTRPPMCQDEYVPSASA